LELKNVFSLFSETRSLTGHCKAALEDEVLAEIQYRTLIANLDEDPELASIIIDLYHDFKAQMLPKLTRPFDRPPAASSPPSHPDLDVFELFSS